MRFTMPAAVLNPALGSLAQVAQRASLPVLSGFLAEVEPDSVRLTAYNLALGLELTLGRVADEPYEPGSCVVGGAILRDLLRHVHGDVSVEGLDSAVLVTYRSGQARFGAMPADEFPRPAFVEPRVTLQTDLLRQGVERTAYATDRQNFATVTSGLSVRVSAGGVDFLATDRHRLASFRAQTHTDTEASVVVPGEALAAVARMCAAAEAQLGWDEHGFTATWKGARLYSRVPEGAFPDVAAKVPGDYAVTVKASRDGLRDALARASVAADQFVGLSVGPGAITLTSEGQAGLVREAMPAETTGAIEIYFDPALLGEALAHLPGDAITVGMNHPEGPVRLVADDHGYAVVMPILPAAASREAAKAS